MIRKTTITAILLLSVMITIISCRGSQHREEINTIDSLILVNDSVALMLQEIDTLKLLDSRKTFARNWVTIKVLVDSLEKKTDLRNDTLWPSIVNYSATDRSLKKLHRRYKRLWNTQQENVNQLQTLRQSVKRGKIPSDSVNMFIGEEAMAVYNTHHEAEMYMPEMKRTVLTLDSLHQHVDAMVEHLRKINIQP